MEYTAIYRKIRELRRKRNTTIQQLSAKTGLTSGYLSKIENSEKPPPIPTLTKIAYALNVHISYFFEENENGGNDLSIVRSGERKEIIGDYTSLGYRYEAVINKKAHGAIKPLVITLPGPVNPESIPFNYHEGEEMIFVLSGRVHFYYGDEIHEVNEGDVVYFDSSIPHKVLAVAKRQAAQILSILSL